LDLTWAPLIIHKKQKTGRAALLILLAWFAWCVLADIALSPIGSHEFRGLIAEIAAISLL